MSNKNTNEINEISIVMDAKSQNEAFARVVIAAFLLPLDPTVNELTDIKTAVSEAVTNAIIHGYDRYENAAVLNDTGSANGNQANTSDKIHMNCKIDKMTLTIEVIDFGRGICDIEQARTPLYTSKPEYERSGMGFTIMETFMDSIIVESNPDKGTKIVMTKTISR